MRFPPHAGAHGHYPGQGVFQKNDPSVRIYPVDMTAVFLIEMLEKKSCTAEECHFFVPAGVVYTEYRRTGGNTGPGAAFRSLYMPGGLRLSTENTAPDFPLLHVSDTPHGFIFYDL